MTLLSGLQYVGTAVGVAVGEPRPPPPPGGGLFEGGFVAVGVGVFVG